MPREHFLFIRQRLGQGHIGGILITLSTIAFIFLGIEGVARARFVGSDWVGTSGIQRVWARNYWNPINSLGFRDVELFDEGLVNVVVVGDSFMAGYGIENVEDRLSGVLQARLGDIYGVNTLAAVGWDTEGALNEISEYPVTPDIIVWSHYFNDIEYLYPEPPISLPRTIFHYWISSFYLTNYLYWHIFPPPSNLLEAQNAVYTDPDLWSQHAATLQRVIEFAQAQNAQLIVVTWEVPVAGFHTTDMVAAHFVEQGIPVVDMGPIVTRLPYDEFAAGPLDPHPNEAMHTLAAELLYERMLQEGWVR